MILASYNTALGAVPGVMGLVAALVGYGKLVQRLKSVEDDMEPVKTLAGQVAAIDERTKATDNAVKEVRGDVSRLVEHFLGAGISMAFKDRRSAGR